MRRPICVKAMIVWMLTYMKGLKKENVQVKKKKTAPLSTIIKHKRQQTCSESAEKNIVQSEICQATVPPVCPQWSTYPMTNTTVWMPPFSMPWAVPLPPQTVSVGCCVKNYEYQTKKMRGVRLLGRPPHDSKCQQKDLSATCLL